MCWQNLSSFLLIQLLLGCKRPNVQVLLHCLTHHSCRSETSEPGKSHLGWFGPRKEPSDFQHRCRTMCWEFKLPCNSFSSRVVLDDAGSTFLIPCLNSMTTHLVLTDAVRNCQNWGFNCRFVGNKPLQPEDRRTAEEACARLIFSKMPCIMSMAYPMTIDTGVILSYYRSWEYSICIYIQYIIMIINIYTNNNNENNNNTGVGFSSLGLSIWSQE